MTFQEIHTCTEMMDFINEVGFLPLLDSGIEGFSAEDIVDEDCGYVTFPDGGYSRRSLWQGDLYVR